MKFKFALSILLFGFASLLFAGNYHSHPAPQNQQQDAGEKRTPGYCEVEIINNSYDIMKVFATFDDLSGTQFDIYPFEAPHTISLYYYGYCHSNVYLEVLAPYYRAYAGYLPVDHTLTIYPNYKMKKAGIQKHS